VVFVLEGEGESRGRARKAGSAAPSASLFGGGREEEGARGCGEEGRGWSRWRAREECSAAPSS